MALAIVVAIVLALMATAASIAALMVAGLADEWRAWQRGPGQ